MRLLSGNTIPITGTVNCWAHNQFFEGPHRSLKFSRKKSKKSKFSKISKKKKFKFATMDRRTLHDLNDANTYLVPASLQPGEILLAQNAFRAVSPQDRAHANG